VRVGDPERPLVPGISSRRRDHGREQRPGRLEDLQQAGGPGRPVGEDRARWAAGTAALASNGTGTVSGGFLGPS
jgi:hypothetical protein